MKRPAQFLALFSLSLAAPLSLLTSAASAANLTVRKNVVDLSAQEKQDLVDAIYTLKHTTPEGSKISIYDQFVAVHIGAMSQIHQHEMPQGSQSFDAAHGNSSFLPWHREYIRRFELALQSVNPDVTLPYWDWTDPEAIDVIFQSDFLGSNGQGVTIDVPGAGTYEGGPISTGNFSPASGWVLDEDLNIDPISGESFGSALTRFLRLPPADDYPIPQEQIDRVLALDDYSRFRPALEGYITVDEEGNATRGGYLHNYIHALVGGAEVNFDPETQIATFDAIGTMSNTPSSPYDPVFWLHHANVDRLWAQWQDDGHAGSAYYPATGQPYGHNLDDPMWPWDSGEQLAENPELAQLLDFLPQFVFSPEETVTPAAVLDHRDLGYTYDTTSTAVPEPDHPLNFLALVGFAVALHRFRP